MSVECLLDTDVLIYAAAGRREAEPKRARAMQLIEAGNFGVSGQILAEFYVTATKKFADVMQPHIAAEWVDSLSRFPVVAIDAALVRIAIDVATRYPLAYWDAAVIAAAESLGATILFSEDLNHGQIYGSVRVRNPFVDL
jgi:predicted nucleic acid-binding protein